jgi:hypothetical protein
MENKKNKEYGQNDQFPQETETSNSEMRDQDVMGNRRNVGQVSHITTAQSSDDNMNLIPNPDDFDEGDNDGGEDSERDATRTPGL